LNKAIVFLLTPKEPFSQAAERSFTKKKKKENQTKRKKNPNPKPAVGISLYIMT